MEVSLAVSYFVREIFKKHKTKLSRNTYIVLHVHCELAIAIGMFRYFHVAHRTERRNFAEAAPTNQRCSELLAKAASNINRLVGPNLGYRYRNLWKFTGQKFRSLYKISKPMLGWGSFRTNSLGLPSKTLLRPLEL